MDASAVKVLSLFIIVSAINNIANCLQCNTADGRLVNGTCFIIFRSKVTWTQAKTECKEHGLTLAALNDLSHAQEAIPTFFQEGIWVGAHRRFTNGSLVWEYDATNISDDLGGDFSSLKSCAVLNESYKINTDECERRLPFVCMAKPTVLAPPGVFKCNCVGGLCSQEYCLGTYAFCNRYYFGKLCQYRNLAAELSMDEATDTKFATCFQNPDKNHYDMEFPIPTFVYLVQAFFVNATIGSIYSLKLNVTGSKYTCGTKEVDRSEQKILISLVCNMSSPVDKIRLTWTGKGLLCDIKVYGGRNVAFNQKYRASSTEYGDASVTLDGVRMTLSDCFRTSSSSTLHYLEVILTAAYYIYSIYVYGSPVSQFKLNCYDKTGVMLPYCHHVPLVSKSFVVFNIIHDLIISKFKISMDNQSKNRSMDICEVEAYGDCIAPNYGIYCNETCHLCPNTNCLFTGQCITRNPDALTTVLHSELSKTTSHKRVQTTRPNRPAVPLFTTREPTEVPTTPATEETPHWSKVYCVSAPVAMIVIAVGMVLFLACEQLCNYYYGSEDGSHHTMSTGSQKTIASGNESVGSAESHSSGSALKTPKVEKTPGEMESKTGQMESKTVQMESKTGDGGSSGSGDDPMEDFGTEV